MLFLLTALLLRAVCVASVRHAVLEDPDDAESPYSSFYGRDDSPEPPKFVTISDPRSLQGQGLSLPSRRKRSFQLLPIEKKDPAVTDESAPRGAIEDESPNRAASFSRDGAGYESPEPPIFITVSDPQSLYGLPPAQNAAAPGGSEDESPNRSASFHHNDAGDESPEPPHFVKISDPQSLHSLPPAQNPFLAPGPPLDMVLRAQGWHATDPQPVQAQPVYEYDQNEDQNYHDAYLHDTNLNYNDANANYYGHHDVGASADAACLRQHPEMAGFEDVEKIRRYAKRPAGTRAMQDLIRRYPECRRLLAKPFHGHVLRLMVDYSGNFVLQAMILSWPPADSQFIAEEIQGFTYKSYSGIVAAAVHEVGCRIVQRLLENNVNLGDSLDKLLAHFDLLVNHKFGNFVIKAMVQYQGTVLGDRLVQALERLLYAPPAKWMLPKDERDKPGACMYHLVVLERAWQYPPTEDLRERWARFLLPRIQSWANSDALEHRALLESMVFNKYGGTLILMVLQFAEQEPSLKLLHTETCAALRTFYEKRNPADKSQASRRLYQYLEPLWYLKKRNAGLDGLA